MFLQPEIEKILPPPREALGDYKVISYAKGIGKISGQFPIVGTNIMTGSIDEEISIDEAHQASEMVALNIIAQIDNIKGEINVTSLLHLDCYVQSAINDKRLVDVLNTLSQMLKKAFGKEAQHSRSLVTVNDLPLNATMEVVTTFTYDEKE